MFPTDYSSAAHLIAAFESFSDVAYWDVNAYRIGYGSDTRTAAQIKVKRGDHETMGDALANLVKRIPQFEATIIHQIGSAKWGQVPTPAKNAFLSFAYNYGSLSHDIVDAFRMGDSRQAIASLVSAHGEDNNGMNRARRRKEAAIIESC
jgi:GH24 family phage-related lysozyme (muramidase)